MGSRTPLQSDPPTAEKCPGCLLSVKSLGNCTQPNKATSPEVSPTLRAVLSSDW